MRWTNFHTFGSFAVLLALPTGTWWLAARGRPLAGWLLALALVAAFMLVAGHGVTGRWRGALIDDRNVMSLSRTQMAIWTAIVLSAYLAAVTWNLAWGHDYPLGVAIPGELWVLMGISTTSLVGSPLIVAGKKTKAPADDEFEAMKTRLVANGEKEGATVNKGLLAVNVDLRDARWSDIVTGEEVANAAHLDLARVQMLFFTLVLAVAYATALGRMFAGIGDMNFEALPDLDQSALALLGISHAGYLTSKGVVHGTTKR